ncbi:MFS transporter, DHA2 family, multidrug resistance protein [Streptomyces sp. di188]|nr:MFS transporter, DHA2 family, multidrug resistance protein [Streptomyces sp. di50b]SCE34642.1 MFS transporter, DHA2 family, multidrug resistance protein [Streptomyces sp. di188]
MLSRHTEPGSFMVAMMFAHTRSNRSSDPGADSFTVPSPRQRTTRSPMVPPALFGVHGFSPALVLDTLSALGMMGSAIFTTQYLQSVLGKSALEAALWSLLPSVLIGVAAPVAATLVQRGAERAHVVTAGFVVSACGYGLLALAGTDSLWLVLAACGVMASGIVVVMSLLTDLALSSAPVDRAGSASSLLETGTEFGGALGMAALGSIGAAVYRHTMPVTAPEPARETLGGALAVAAEMPGRAGDALTAAAREAFTTGMRGAAIAGAVLLLVAAGIAAAGLRHIRARPDTENAGQAGSLSPSGV